MGESIEWKRVALVCAGAILTSAAMPIVWAQKWGERNPYILTALGAVVALLLVTAVLVSPWFKERWRKRVDARPKLWIPISAALFVSFVFGSIYLCSITIRINKAHLAEIAKREASPPTAEAVARALRKLDQPSATDKTARKALRKSLTEFLRRGEEHRRILNGIFDEDLPRGAIARKINAINKWDSELIEYLRATLGDASAETMRATIPSGTYPAGPYYLDVQQAWDRVISNLGNIRELLREHPEL